MNMLENIKDFTLIQWVFYVLSVLTLFGAIGTVLSKNAMHSVLYLVLTFFSISGLYVLLNAQFLAAVNIIVYAGAIMVLFLFVLMFLNLKNETSEFSKKSTMVAAGVSAGVLGLLLVGTIRLASSTRMDPSTYNSKTGLIETLGDTLYNNYMLPFELISILFLVAIAGSVLLGKKEKGENNF
ncbi:MAG: NADH-quinone oxidoreductase subunit J family protein [Leadbetterella sp.]